jgi:hypothetical protein
MKFDEVITYVYANEVSARNHLRDYLRTLWLALHEMEVTDLTIQTFHVACLQ